MTAIVDLPVVETPTLLLREVQSRDVGELTAFMTQTRYQRHIAHRMKDDVAVADFVRRQLAAQSDPRRQVFHLAAEEKLSGEVVGEGFIIAHAGVDHELGWGVHPAMWSMGLGTEIANALVAIGFERLKAKALWCKVMTANGASSTVARRIGMKLTQHHDDYPIGQGRRGPVDVFRMTAWAYFDQAY